MSDQARDLGTVWKRLDAKVWNHIRKAMQGHEERHQPLVRR